MRYSFGSNNQGQINAYDGEMDMYSLSDSNTTKKRPECMYPSLDSRPRRHKAKIVVWEDLTVRILDRLNESLSPEHVKHVLADIFVLNDFKENAKTRIVMDLYYYTLQFCREQSFNPRKTSAFFSIIKNIFEVCIETPYGNLDHAFEYFKGLINCHSINRPPFSIELFNCNDVIRMTEYTINSFFRHFKMYKYTFAPLIRLDLSLNYIGNIASPPLIESTSVSTETSYSDVSDMDDDRWSAIGMKKKSIRVTEEDIRIARERCKKIITAFLRAETKRIETNVDDHMKAINDIINFMIRRLTGTTKMPSS